jgi:hypothetical protein
MSKRSNMHRNARLGVDRRAMVREIVDRRRSEAGDDGLTLIELLVAFTAMLVLFGIIGTVITVYLSTATTVVSTYNNVDQILPGTTTIQRLIRSQVEPAPVNGSGVPAPPFVTSSVGTTSVTFYANIGDANGPAKIVMASGTPTKCSNCRFYTSIFTVTQYPANSGTCPGVSNGTACTWSSTGRVLVNIYNVVNGQANLPDPTTPIFTYNTYVTSTSVYSPNVATSVFSSCTASSCPGDNIQSVGVDLEVQTQGAPIQESYFVVYRLSSYSYLYSPLVG